MWCKFLSDVGIATFLHLFNALYFTDQKYFHLFVYGLLIKQLEYLILTYLRHHDSVYLASLGYNYGSDHHTRLNCQLHGQ